MLRSRVVHLLALSLLLPTQMFGQNSTTTGAAAGLAAGAALGAAGAQSSNAGSSASSAGGSNAPIEMNIMVYGGIKQIAQDIAVTANNALRNPASDACQPGSTSTALKLLLEDSNSTPQVALYQTFDAYERDLTAILMDIKGEIDSHHTAIKKIIEGIPARKAEEEKEEKERQQRQGGAKNKGITPFEELQEQPGAITPSAASGASPSASSTTPIGLTYLGDISSAIAAAKNGITYSPSSVQPTTQALTTELAKDLHACRIALYTSTSPVNLAGSNDVVLRNLALQKLNADIQSDSAINISTASTTNANETEKAMIQTETSAITALASTANQLATAFQTWLSTSDGSGFLVLTDVIRGSTLSMLIGSGIPALQFTIDAAGGNTRTNSVFFLNLFYTPKPSFNAGVVVTYELRGTSNEYLVGDTLKVIYDYSKWAPKCFLLHAGPQEVDGTALPTGRVSTGVKRVDDPVVCEYK